jgi:DNA-binding CsgD family transcriptional regulator
MAIAMGDMTPQPARNKASPMHDQSLRKHVDRQRCGMVLCDARGRVHWLNGSAKRLLASGPLRLAGSRLLGDSEADTEKLMQELAEVVVGTGNTVRYLRLGEGDMTRHVAIQAAAQPNAIALTLTSPSQDADIPLEALIRLFGLTPTEAGLVAALANGSTAEQYAQRRGVSMGTVRVQLKHIHVKTGARRQSELIRLVWSSAAMHLSHGGADPALGHEIHPGHRC